MNKKQRNNLVKSIISRHFDVLMFRKVVWEEGQEKLFVSWRGETQAFFRPRG